MLQQAETQFFWKKANIIYLLSLDDFPWQDKMRTEKIQYFVKQWGDTGRAVSETKATNRRRATWPEIFTLRIKSQINRIMGVMQAIKNLE